MPDYSPCKSRNIKQLCPELEAYYVQAREVMMDDESPLDPAFFPDSGVVLGQAVYSDGGQPFVRWQRLGGGCNRRASRLGARFRRLVSSRPNSRERSKDVAFRLSHAPWSRTVVPKFMYA